MAEIPTVDELLAELDRAAEEHRLGKDVGPTRQQWLVRRAAAALRAQIAETKRLRAQALGEVSRLALATVDQRDHAEEMADKLAAALAPGEVLGEHSNANDPWQNALDYVNAGELHAMCVPADVHVRELAEVKPLAEALDDVVNEILENAGDEWDDDESASAIAVRYVRHLEALAEARAAVPQPLWSDRCADARWIDLKKAVAAARVGPRERLVLYRADQTPAGVSRDEVLKAVGAGFTTALGPDQLTSVSVVECIADAVWALLRGEANGG